MVTDLTHLNENNLTQMVNIEEKANSKRTAMAFSCVTYPPDIFAKLSFTENNQDLASKKGPVFNTAMVAGTLAVKQTQNLIPLCHSLAIENCQFRIEINKTFYQLEIYCEVSANGKTGVEMEALTGASICALTIYDMCKCLSQQISIGPTKLLWKRGGKSDYNAPKEWTQRS